MECAYCAFFAVFVSQTYFRTLDCSARAIQICWLDTLACTAGHQSHNLLTLAIKPNSLKRNSFQKDKQLQSFFEFKHKKTIVQTAYLRTNNQFNFEKNTIIPVQGGLFTMHLIYFIETLFSAVFCSGVFFSWLWPYICNDTDSEFSPHSKLVIRSNKCSYLNYLLFCLLFTLIYPYVERSSAYLHDRCIDFQLIFFGCFHFEGYSLTPLVLYIKQSSFAKIKHFPLCSDQKKSILKQYEQSKCIKALAVRFYEWNHSQTRYLLHTF